MRFTIHLVATLTLACSFYNFAGEQAPTLKLYENEKQILFKANSGETTDAVEGHLWVPENRANPYSRKIRVNYVRFPATGSKSGSPIVYLSGGPGGSGISTAKWRRYPLFQALREFGDVIALDQRGTGQSEQAAPCVSTQKIPLNKAISAERVTQHYRAAARECFASWQSQGYDIYGYNSNQNALDINDLRTHLNADKVTLWGISYGSHLALAAMKLFPQHINKVIIASAEGLNQTVKLPAQTDLYFKKLQGVIDQQALKTDIPNLSALMKRVHAKLDEAPQQIAIPNRDGSITQLLFQTHHLQTLASKMIADPNHYLAILLHIYLGLDNNNTELLSAVLQRGMFKDEPITLELMPLAMDIASGISNERLAQVKHQARSALLAEQLNFPMPHLNKLDSKLDLGEAFRADAKSSIPTLLFSGSLDGRTYPKAQIKAVQGLSNLTHVMVNNAGHNLYTSSPEVRIRIKAFLAGNTVNQDPINLPLPRLSMPER
ncbi:alpha/beta hydrolase [Pseudoalteromonas luteoviolacea]|uniref:Proline iminopeptidase n=1 Tax=Pseudoalteromonas luteoviolacea TaxID=43657 RepID=A0A0C1QJ37_9GAMM|nr:alpha/beta fold hydrolase [Pseudoalteromonas luteoviolacea]KID55117.1 alpha/beta hydrolase [Pseudoalteromonas luteoviolacea]